MTPEERLKEINQQLDSIKSELVGPGKKSETYWLILILLICLSIFIIDINVPLGIAMGIPYVIPMMLTLKLSSRKYTFLISLLCCFLIGAGFLYSELTTNDTLLKATYNRVLTIFEVISITYLISKIKRIII